jgi:hypothetical protein
MPDLGLLLGHVDGALQALELRGQAPLDRPLLPARAPPQEGAERTPPQLVELLQRTAQLNSTASPRMSACFTPQPLS